MLPLSVLRYGEGGLDHLIERRDHDLVKLLHRDTCPQRFKARLVQNELEGDFCRREQDLSLLARNCVLDLHAQSGPCRSWTDSRVACTTRWSISCTCAATFSMASRRTTARWPRPTATRLRPSRGANRCSAHACPTIRSRVSSGFPARQRSDLFRSASHRMLFARLRAIATDGLRQCAGMIVSSWRPCTDTKAQPWLEGLQAALPGAYVINVARALTGWATGPAGVGKTRRSLPQRSPYRRRVCMTLGLFHFRFQRSD